MGIFGGPTNEAMGLGLRVPSTKAQPDPATRMGLGEIQNTQADTAVSGRPVRDAALKRLEGVASAMPPAAPVATARPPATVYFNESTNEMYAGDQAFKADDVASALQAAQRPGNTTRPQGQGWTSLPESSFESYLSSFSAPRGIMGNLGVGAQQVGESLVGGAGRGLQLLGAENVGRSIADFANEYIGTSESQDARSALIAAEQGFIPKAGTAIVQGAPSLGVSIGAGAAGAYAGGQLGLLAGPGGAAVGAFVGSLVGIAGSILPMELYSSWEAAEQNGLSTDDDEVRTDIITSSLLKTAAQTAGPAILVRGISPALRKVVGDATRRTMGGRVKYGLGTGAVEGMAEVTASVVDKVMFDPELRAILNSDDRTALAPLVLDRYGEELAIDFVAGLALGGGVGALTAPSGPRPQPKRNVDSGDPVNVLNGANLNPVPASTEQTPPPTAFGYTEPSEAMFGAGATDLTRLPPTAQDYVSQPGLDYTSNIPAGMGSLLRGIPTTPAAQTEQPADAFGYTEPSGGVFGTTDLTGLVPRAPEPAAQPAFDYTANIPAGMGSPLRDVPRSLATTEQVPLVAQRRFGIPARENQLLRTRPSMRPQEEVATATVEPTGPSPFGEQLLRALAQRQQQAAQPAFDETTSTEPAAESAVEAVVDPNEITPREYRDVYATWEQVRAEQPNPDIFPDFDRLRTSAQWAWVDAVRNQQFLLPDGSVDVDFFQELAKRKQKNKAPLVETGVSRRETGPAAEDVDFLRRRTEQLRAREALAQGVQARGARLRDLGSRLEARKPVVPALPEGVFGTKEGKPFRNKPAANGAKPSVAKREGVAATTLTAVEVPGGFGLRVTSPAAPVTPPVRGTKGTQEGRVRKGPAAAPKGTKSEAAPAPEPEVQAPVKATGAAQPEQTLAERVDALSQDDAFRLQELIDPTGDLDLDIDTAVETKPKLVEAALRKIATPVEVVDAAATKLATLADTNPDVTKLAGMITEFNVNSPLVLEESWGSRFRQAAMNVKEKAAKARLGDQTLLSYVTKDNNPNFVVVDGKRQIVSSEGTGKPMLSTWNTIDGVVDLDGKPVTPMATGRVQMLIQNFTSKMARAPKITVARSQADLKAKNPELYKQAVAARPQGDFDTIPAMGYSFGDGQVIIFTDRIGTEQQLRFVLAHEALGHYGLRSVMPAGKFNAAMDQVYNSNPRVAATVDQAVEVRGLSRAEATEEFLADYAAVLDMSLLRRVAGAMKTALNAVGFRFSDDMVRHLLRMSRRYVRNGKQDSLFTVESIFTDIRDIESGTDQQGTGRFKSGFASDNIRVDRLIYNVHGLPRTVDEVTAALKPSAEKVSLYAESILRKAFSLTGFNALDNAGSSVVNEILSKGGEVTADIRNRSDAKLRYALDREVRIAGIKVASGITETEQLAASRLNYGQQDDIRGKVDAKIASVVKALKAAGKSPRMFTISGDTVVPNPDAIDAYANAGMLEISEAKAILAKDDRYKKIADELNKDHPTWKAYREVREVEQMVDVEFVRANYEALVADRKNGIEAVASMLTSKTDNLTDKDRAMLEQIMDKYTGLYSGSTVVIGGNVVATDASAKAAEKFLKTVNEAFIAKGFDTVKEDALRKFFSDKLADDFVAQFVSLRKRITRTSENEFLLQKTIKDIGASERSYSSAEESVRQMLVQGYTPIVRKDEQFQMRLAAYDPETGEFVQMSDDARGKAAYRVFGTLQEATTLANLANAPFLDTTTPVDEDVTDVEIVTLKDGTTKRLYKVEGRVDGKSDFTSRSVELRFEVSEAASGVDTSLELNVHEFLRGAQRFGFDIRPSQLEKIIVAMTAQDARARKRLQQTGNPGYEVQGGVTAMEAMARHVDSRSALIAKIKMRPALDKVMNLKLPSSRKLWFGDTEKLDRLEKAYNAALADPNASEGARDLAKREYTDYAYKMRKTVTEKNGVPVNLGNKYYSENQSLMAFINGNRDVNETDWGAGAVPSWVRRWAGASQLGGTLTQPIMNNIGPFTNFIPWLGTFNEKNGFGGGAGITNAYTQYLKAVSDVGGSGGLSFSERALKMHTGEYWLQVADGLDTHPGVTKPEAEFIGKETLSGILTPAQANSLLGASRGFTTNPAVRQALEKWMFFYVSSEQATRRSAALAAFRVEWQRQTSAIGKAPNDKLTEAEYKRIHARASDFATQGVLLTLGDYGAKARPAVWRSGFQSFLYMYKVWPTTTIQTLSRLSLTGKAMMMAPLLLASGVAGMPFAEDGEDFIDTILQRTGSTTGSVRMELARLIDGIWPGASPYILKGVLSSILGSDVAGRFGTGDFLPGTAGFLPGQELSATVREVLGPAWGFVEGTFVGGSQLAAAPFSDTATVVDAMRGGPITIFRALGDAVAYNSAGAVIDKRGYVIDPDLTTGMLIGRVLGFTPVSVASKYEVIRLAKRETNYQKQVVTKFRVALLKAEMSGDKATAASIRRTVKEWNEVNKGTLLEIKNFEKNYQRLNKLANMSATQRFMQSVGKNNQQAVELTNELIGFD